MKLYVRQLSSYVDLDIGKKEFSMLLMDDRGDEHVVPINESTYAALTELLDPDTRPPPIPEYYETDPPLPEAVYEYEGAPACQPTADVSSGDDSDDGVPSL